MDYNELIGYLAASLTTFSFLPQAIKVIKTKETKGISLIMYVIFTMGVLMWTVYGILISNMPMLGANIVTLLFASIILFFKVKDVKKRDDI